MASDTIVKTIDQQRWLDPVGNQLRLAVHESFRAGGAGGQQVKNFLHGTWLRHPLHPVLIHVPVGAWTVAMVLDALDGIGGQKELRAASDAAIGLGLLGAAGAALTGLTDWSDTDGRARRVGLVHGLLNVAAAALYTGSWILRKRRRSRATGLSLSMLGYAIVSASAYLGGHLVYAEQIGVDHTATAGRGQPDRFVAVMADDDLPEKKLTGVKARDTDVLLVRVNGKIHALANTCAHMGGPLAEGKLGERGTVVRCPWHGSRFALDDGSVVDGPATCNAPRFDVRVRKGQIEVRASED
jgi:nitrite reductase/ring-hydroxylating ferredoxin subunit/uncharacterized membrane protein